MKQRRIGRKGRAAPVVPVLALLLFIAVMVTVPVAFSKYLAKGEGSAGVRIAKWDPKATVSPETILFRDITPMNYIPSTNSSTAAVHALSNVFNLGYTFDNRGTEVKTRYMMVPPDELAPGGAGNPLLPYAFADRPTAPDPWKWPVATLQPDVGPVAGFDAYDPGNPAKTYNAKWRRWYANDVRIDTSKGNNGLVWEQDFSNLAGTGITLNAGLSGTDNTPSSYSNLFSQNGGGGGVYIPTWPSDVWIRNDNFRNIIGMNGNYMALGTSSTAAQHDHHCRWFLFNRPANVGNHWAMEFDLKFADGDGSHDVRRGHLFLFVIWDSETTHTGTSAPSVAADVYAFGIRRQAIETQNPGTVMSGTDGWNHIAFHGNSFFSFKFGGISKQGGNGSGSHYGGMPKYVPTADSVSPVPVREDLMRIQETRQYNRRLTNNRQFEIGSDWIHVRVERSGARFTMYVNGEQVIQFNHLITNKANYKIGFGEMRNTVGIDNIKMWALEDLGDNTAYGVIPPSASGMYRQIDINAVQAD